MSKSAPRAPSFLLFSRDNLLRQSLSAKLRRERFGCVDYYGVEEVRAELDQRRHEVLVVDLVGNPDGLSLLNSLTESPGLVVLLADGAHFDRQRRLSPLVDALFLRPLRLDVMVEVIRDLLVKCKLPVLRRHPRVSVRLTARLGTRRARTHAVHNLSAGGMFIEGDFGREEFVRFSLHEGSRRHSPLRGIARPRWRTKTGVGFQFTCLFHNVTGQDIVRFAAEHAVEAEGDTIAAR